jgi:uncharacterized membrane protein
MRGALRNENEVRKPIGFVQNINNNYTFDCHCSMTYRTAASFDFPLSLSAVTALSTVKAQYVVRIFRVHIPNLTFSAAALV